MSTLDVSRDKFSAEFPDVGFTSRRGSRILFLQSAIVGLAYTAFEWTLLGNVQDTAFVSMLVGATALLALGVRSIAIYVADHALNYFRLVSDEVTGTVGGYQDLVWRLFNPRHMWMAGLVYAATVGSAPLFTSAWPEQPFLRMALCGLLFSVNFPTGVAFYGLLGFILRANKMSRFAPVHLWHIEDPATEFLLTTTRRIVLLAAGYTAICIASIPISVIPIEDLVIAYSVFAGGVILTSYFMPIMPFVLRMRREKRKALQEVSRELQEEFESAVTHSADGGGSLGPEALEQTQTLMDLRKEIASAQVWPFRSQIVTTIIYVVSVSALPPVLQTLLEGLF